MKINVNYFCNYGVSCLKEIVLPSLTAQQKKILGIISLAFGLLAACYGVKRCFFAKPLNGQGKRIDRDGVVMEGQFRDGKLHGQGKKTYSFGLIQEGEFINGWLIGQGKVIYPGGIREEGEFKNSYLGEGRDGKLNGEGKRIYSDGRIEEGKFKDGVLIQPKKEF